ncbi:MAG TPA: glycosyltransferase [Lachnospiraceae bacterium]|nr:glycosyltransferase [Lachnospiraceae bacterium]
MMMSKINKANLKKTIYYLKRNGLRDTFLAALERLQKSKQETYEYHCLSAKVLEEQRVWSKENQQTLFSIVVPAYHTAEIHLRAMIESVLAQSYENFELVIADAGNEVKKAEIVKSYKDSRICYLPLRENLGISDNTNEALQHAKGDYVGLLDHDDILTADALYEVAVRINQYQKEGKKLQLVYSDEDKCDDAGEHYFERHSKLDFNLDLILSNNYICHFLVVKADLIKRLGFRKEFDGAQDYDLVLRCIRDISNGYQENHDTGVSLLLPFQEKDTICHIPKVLYHWRCHKQSTAENPQSKQYAYEAGGRVIADFLSNMQIAGEVAATRHLGFYQIQYQPDMLSQRTDVGAIGGKILNSKNKITGGIYCADGDCPYQDIYKGYSGYMHRAMLTQDAYAVDIRLMQIRPDLFDTVNEIVEKYMTSEEEQLLLDGNVLDCSRLSLDETQFRRLSMEASRRLYELNYRVVWNPSWTKRI